MAKKSAKVGIMETDVCGAKAYHAKCLEPMCAYVGRRHDRHSLAVKDAAKHGEEHVAKQ
jgi:hypothetical protein